jgi:hypothetical protein
MVRPERPDDEDAPQLSDAVWKLAEKCWAKDPKHRPTADTVCNIISRLHDTTTNLKHNSPSSTISPAKSRPLPMTIQAPPHPLSLPDSGSELNITGSPIGLEVRPEDKVVSKSVVKDNEVSYLGI